MSTLRKKQPAQDARKEQNDPIEIIDLTISPKKTNDYSHELTVNSVKRLHARRLMEGKVAALQAAAVTQTSKCQLMHNQFTKEKIAALRNERRLQQVQQMQQEAKDREQARQEAEKAKAAAEVVQRAMSRERQHRSHAEMMAGEQELPNVLKTLNRYYDPAERRFRAVPEKPETAAEKPLQKQQQSMVKAPAKSAEKDNTMPNQTDMPRLQLNSKLPVEVNPAELQLPAKPTPTKVERPIIIVPESMSSIITLYNAKELLQNLRFVPSAKMRRQTQIHLEEVIVEHRWRNKLLSFRVVDNIGWLTQKEWTTQVAAVFMQGPLWQFKTWPWHGDPVEIFKHICPFHLCHHDEPPQLTIQKLGVNILTLSHDPGQDRYMLSQFWTKLDEHIEKNPEKFAFLNEPEQQQQRAVKRKLLD